MKAWETPVTFWRVHHATRHFQFEAFAHTLPEAKHTMRLALEEHAAQCAPHIDPQFVTEGMRIIEDDQSWAELRLGAGYRDSQPIVTL